MTRIIAIIEARMASSRLPGKVMLPLGKRRVIDLIVERLRKSTKLDNICIATTRNDEDKIIVDHFQGTEVIVFRGSDWNVFDRVFKAAKKYNAEIIVEITGDCPFVDPKLVDYMVDLLQNNDLAYIANNFYTSFADGFDIQVYYLDALEKMAGMEIGRAHV